MSTPPPAHAQEQLAELVGRVAADGDREAFGDLFGHFAPRLKSFYLRQGAAADVAEELTQECMIVLWRRAAHYDPRTAAVSTWLYTIARNLGIDRLRRERWLDAEPALEDAAHGAAEDDPERVLLDDERDERVRRALKALPAEQRRVVEMHYYQWRSSGEIATLEGLPDGTVKSRMRLALKRLRAHLKEP